MAIRYLSGVNIDSNTLVVDDVNNRVGIGRVNPTTNLEIFVDSNGGNVHTYSRLHVKAGTYGAISIGSPADGAAWYMFGDVDDAYVAGMAYEHSVDAMYFNVNNDTAVYINSSRNVGIGTTNPAQKLDVVGKMKISDDIILAQTNGRIDYDNGAAGALRFFSTSASAERMRITSAGNVGIGTTSPTSYSGFTTLSINNATNGGVVDLLTNGTRVGSFYNTASTVFLGSITNIPLRFDTNNTERMRITAAGNVGIGTTSPGSLLHLYKANGDAEVISERTDAGTGARYALSAIVAGTTRWRLATIDNSAFATFVNGSERMRITSTGNVGIGTTAPVGKLVVIGANSNTYLSIDNVGSGENYFAANALHVFQTAGSERMRIDASGNVGIGTTSPTVTLEVSGRGLITSSGSSDTFAVTHSSGSGIGVNITKGCNGEGLYVNKTSGTGNAVTIVGTLNATTLVKSGGTSSQYLMADGSVSTLTNPVTGTGTTNYVPKWTSGSAIGNSQIFDDGTNVGIGVTSPNGKLEIRGLRSATKNLLLNLSKFDYGATAFYQNYSNTFYTNGKSLEVEVEALPLFQLATNNAGTDGKVIFPNGNVGIGTTSELARTTILSDSSAQTIGLIGRSADNIATIRWWNNAGNTIYTAIESNANYTIYNTVTNGYAAFFTNNSERLRITSGGNVGIGTTSPSYKLDVNGKIYSSTEVQGGTAYMADISGVSSFGSNTSTRSVRLGRDGTINDIFINGSDGYIGMGTNGPTQKLQVNGNVRVTGAYYDSNNEAGTSGQVLTSTGTGTDWVTPATTTATSLYDLLPAARVAYNWTGQVVNDTWVDIFSAANNILTTGTWMVQMYISDWAQGGQHYTYTYTGTMQWYQETVNQGGESAASEIYLHRMGHAANASVLYLRTTEMTAVSGGIGKLQVKANYSNTSNTTINFKFVKIF